MGYYGDDTYQTNCLVLLKEPADRKKIKYWLVKISRLHPMYEEEPSLAVQLPGYRWLGIDSSSLQDNVNAKTMQRLLTIFDCPFLLYHEFDGDLLSVGWGDPESGKAYCRYAASDPELLSEYGYEKDGDFPEDLFPFMDCSRKEAEAIWHSGDYTFEIDKMADLAKKMTLAPVPEIFIGKYDLKEIPKNALIIRHQGVLKTGTDGLDAKTRLFKKIIPDLVKSINPNRKNFDRRTYKGYAIDLPPELWTEMNSRMEPSKTMRQDLYSCEHGMLNVQCITNPFSMNLESVSKKWDQTPEQFQAESVPIPGAEVIFYEKRDLETSVVREYKITCPEGGAYAYRHCLHVAAADESYTVDLILSVWDTDKIKEYDKAFESFRLCGK